MILVKLSFTKLIWLLNYHFIWKNNTERSPFCSWARHIAVMGIQLIIIHVWAFLLSLSLLSGITPGLALRLSSNRAQTQSSVSLTYFNLRHYDVSDAAQHSHKVKHIPGVFQVILKIRELERSFGDRLERLTISNSNTGTFYSALKD